MTKSSQTIPCARLRPSLVVCALTISLFCGCQKTPPIESVKPDGKQPVIRVRIASPTGMIQIAVNGPFTVQTQGQQKILVAKPLPLTTVRSADGHIRIGKRTIPFESYLDIKPKRSGTLRVGDRWYAGNLRLHRMNDGKLLGVNHIWAEDYVKGVLPAELFPKFLLETYKAQAVAARTYVLFEKAKASRSRLYDLDDTESSQVYSGLTNQTSKSIGAVNDTRGIVLTGKTSRGLKVFIATFSSTCGVITEPASTIVSVNPEFRPLKGGVRCPFCAISPHRNWRREGRISSGDLTGRVNRRHGTQFEQITGVSVTAKTRHGRIREVKIDDITGKSIAMSGGTFRLTAGSRTMRSTWCKIRKDGTDFVFYDGHGFGHGAGMCQYGAEGMARKGHTAIEILTHYYPTAVLKRAY